MNVPATVDGGVVAIPVLPCADIGVNEAETCASVFRSQFKGDRSGARLKNFPAKAEMMGRIKYENLANFDQVGCPLEPDRAPGAQIDLGLRKKPAFQIFPPAGKQ
jgi:hypothetical protein